MAEKRIQVIVDIESKDVQIATDKVLSLQQQIRILTKEIQNVDPQSESFKVLSKKLNDTRDQLQAVSARSGELFNSFSLLPGPIGEISSRLDGGISLLKTFSQFKLSDLQSQFKGLGTDLKEIFASIGSIGEVSDKVTEKQEDLSSSVEGTTQSYAAAGAQIDQNVQASNAYVNTLNQKIQTEADYQAALKSEIALLDETILQNGKNTKEGKAALEQRKIYNQELQTSEQYSKRYSAELQSLTGNQQANTESAKQDAAAQKGVGVASQVATVSTTEQTVATRALTAAQTGAATAARILRGVLISLGIGAIIVLITSLISEVYEWATSTKEAEEAQKKLNDELERTNELIELDKATMERANAERIAAMKASGATEKQIREQQLKDRYQTYSKAFDDEKEAIRLYNNALDKGNQETQDKLADNLTKRTEATRNALSSYRVLVSENIAATNKEIESAAAKEKEKRDKNAAETLAKRKAELDAQIELEIRSATTRKDVLEKLLKDRLDLEKLTGAQLLLAQQENQDKLTDALKDDLKQDLDLRLKSIDAIIEREQSAADVDIDRLKKLLLHKRDIELQNTELILEERQALVAKYDAQIREIDNKAREQKLIADIAANEGNFEEQTRLYKEFQAEAINNENLNADEKIRIVENTNNKINELNERRIEFEKNEIQQDLMDREITYGEYFDNLKQFYDDEIAKVEESYRNKEITEEQHNQRIKELTDARIQIRQAEIDTSVKLFQAIGQGLQALSGIVGEQTKAGKAFAVAAALINTYAAIAGQLAAFAGVPIPGYAIAQAIATGLVGFAQVRKILQVNVPGAGTSGGGQQQPPGSTPVGPIQVQAGGRARGGFVSGPGTSLSDSIPAMLSNGEFVVNARSTEMFGGLLNMINSAGNQPRMQFALGGQVAPQNAPVMQDSLGALVGLNERPIKTYVVANEMSNQQQFDRTIKSRSLI